MEKVPPKEKVLLICFFYGMMGMVAKRTEFYKGKFSKRQNKEGFK